jgi:O-antigen chain-terminating methyltransferase
MDTHTRAMEARMEVLESVSRGLERIVSKISSADNSDISKSRDTQGANAENRAEQLGESSPDQPIDYSYLMLENRYRGSEQAIRERLSYYPAFFKGVVAPVLEIGAGRGELQQLLQAAKVPSYAIEMDPAMVQACQDKGLRVLSGDGLTHLEQLEDSSLGGLIAIQVIEHLTQEQLKSLVTLCLKKVKSGGKVIFETINTESMVALARNYFRDPTHIFPLHPETMRFMLELMGLKVVAVNKLSAYSPEATLQEIEVAEFMSPRWAVTVETLNRNIRRLNDLLYGYQDYCIIAEV